MFNSPYRFLEAIQDTFESNSSLDWLFKICIPVTRPFDEDALFDVCEFMNSTFSLSACSPEDMKQVRTVNYRFEVAVKQIIAVGCVYEAQIPGEEVAVTVPWKKLDDVHKAQLAYWLVDAQKGYVTAPMKRACHFLHRYSDTKWSTERIKKCLLNHLDTDSIRRMINRVQDNLRCIQGWMNQSTNIRNQNNYGCPKILYDALNGEIVHEADLMAAIQWLRKQIPKPRPY